ncbi:hypothetical protein G7046_g1686 [Stylonectria norvegica]|nr:hypothetical protein G7046_g1686 [Stylonectria norvegica]
MLCVMLENSDFSNDNFLSNPALGAAEQILQWGDPSRLRTLWESKLGHQLLNLDFFRLIIDKWSNPGTYYDTWDPVFDLVDHVSDILVQEQWGNELLCLAARTGCMPMVRRLMIGAQHKEDLRRELLCGSRCEQQHMPGRPLHQSVGEAVSGGHFDVVEYLLQSYGIKEHVQFRNLRGENVLHLASKLCNPAMFRLLVPHLQEGIHQTDDHGDTALEQIIMSSSASGDRYESARILLQRGGANQEGHSCGGQQNPLRLAVRLGDVDMCHILVSIGKISPLSAMTCNDDGQMVLMDEVPENKEIVPEILTLLRANMASTSAP